MTDTKPKVRKVWISRKADENRHDGKQRPSPRLARTAPVRSLGCRNATGGSGVLPRQCSRHQSR